MAGHPTDETDAQLATRLAVEAGRLLVRLREEAEQRHAPSWQMMDAGDAVSHRFLIEELRSARPDDAVMSEEGSDDLRRFERDHCWIVDPLDGTNEYGEHGRVDWTVHVALWSEGRLAAGAVSLPAIDAVFSTEHPPVVPPMQRPHPRLVTSRTRNPQSAVVVARALGCDAIRLGSAGAKTMAVILGEADIYVHDGGMYQWDSAAPIAVALAAGLHASRLDGSPMAYNHADPWLPDLIVCRPEFADDALSSLRAAGWG
ncbi:MAG: 3'(2'),5'-bisphosphate nucleotidase CysQ [Ilumatobacteraceae bacterium]